jgi:glycosyltransferase involved in cell wall biosynthesis
MRDGYDVILVVGPDTEPGAVRFLRASGLDLVLSESLGAESTDHLSLVTEAGRERGYAGVIYHPDPTETLDYESSAKRLAESQRYAIPGKTTSESATKDILVGIPAYNEEVGIGSTVHGAAEYADEVLVVDDGSDDRTAEIAEAAGATVTVHEENTGKGGAVKTLFDEAAERDFEVFVLLDGDGQHVPAEIPDVAAPVLEGECDISIGSRYLEQGEEDETPAYRRVGQRVLDIATLGTSGQNLTDTQSGFRAFSPTAVAELSLSTDDIGVETEIIDSAAQQGLEMTETPIEVRYEGIDGQTHSPLYHGLTVITFVLALIRDRHPLVFFGVPGLLLVFVGGLYGIDGILVYRSTGEFYPAKVLASGFLTILGSLGLFTGLVLNRIGNMLGEREV